MCVHLLLFPLFTMDQPFLFLKCYMNKVICVCLILRSYSVLNCASPSNSGSTVDGLFFDGRMNDSLFDSLMDPPSLTGLCPPMQVQRSCIM